MKKYVLIGIVTLSVIALLYLVYATFFREEVAADPVVSNERAEPEIMQFEYMGQSQYFSKELFKGRWRVDRPITYWQNIYYYENDLETSATVCDFSIPESLTPEMFDFENYGLILSYGRQILDMERQYRSVYGMYEVIVTFAEEHEGDVVFFYRIDNINVLPSSKESSGYVMSGEEKIFLEDIQDLNEYEPNDGWPGAV